MDDTITVQVVCDGVDLFLGVASIEWYAGVDEGKHVDGDCAAKDTQTLGKERILSTHNHSRTIMFQLVVVSSSEDLPLVPGCWS